MQTDADGRLVSSHWVRKRVGKRGTTYRGYYRDRAGVTRSAGTHSTSAEAAVAASLGALASERGTGLRGDGGITLRKYSEQLLSTGHWRSLSETDAARSRLTTHVWPHLSEPDNPKAKPLGDVPLHSITRTNVKDLIAALQHTQRLAPVRGVGDYPQKTRRSASEATAASDRPTLSAKTVRNVHATLSSVLAAAVDEERIPTNPAAKIALPDLVRRNKPVIDEDGVRRLLQVFHQDYRFWLPLVLVDLEVGCRWGELIALRPSDLRGTYLHIERVIGESTYAGVERAVAERRLAPTHALGRFYVKDYPKGKEDRRVAVSPTTVDIWHKAVADRGILPDDRLFVTQTGGIPSRATFLTDVLRPALRAARLDPRLRTHDLRGACASLLLANGAEAIFVMERQGWKNMQTVARYRQVMPRDEAHAKALFGGLFDGAS